VGGTDLPPTFFGFAGLKLPWKMHGHDLAPLLKKPGRRWEHPALTILTGQSFGADTDRVPVDPAKLYATAKVPWWVSLAKGRHKYIRTLVKGEIEELYDLENDPGELHNLALEPAHRKRLRTMRAATIAELKRTDAVMADHLPAVGTPE
jgi:arylsulfatase A-like enzyme